MLKNREVPHIGDRILEIKKLTLNAKKSNFVIFRPYQRKIDTWYN